MQKGFVYSVPMERASDLIVSLAKWDSATGWNPFVEYTTAVRDGYFHFFAPFGNHRGKNMRKMSRFLSKRLGMEVQPVVIFQNFTKDERILGFLLPSFQEVGWAECLTNELLDTNTLDMMSSLIGKTVSQTTINNPPDEYSVLLSV